MVVGLVSAMTLPSASCDGAAIGSSEREPQIGALGLRSADPVAVVDGGPCGGVLLAYVGRDDALVWTCNDGSLVVSRRKNPMAKIRRIAGAYVLFQYWIEEGPTEVALVTFHRGKQGRGTLRYAYTVTGRRITRPLLWDRVDPLETMSANPGANCLMAISARDVTTRNVRVFPYPRLADEPIDLRGVPDLEVVIPADATNGADASWAGVRCDRDSAGRAVVYASEVERSKLGTAEAISLAAYTAEGRKILAGSRDQFHLAYPRVAGAIGGIDVGNGTAIILRAEGPTVERIPPAAGARWVAFDADMGVGIQARVVGAGTDPSLEELVRVGPSGVPAPDPRVLVKPHTTFDKTVSTAPGTFTLLARTVALISSNGPQTITGSQVVWASDKRTSW